MHSFLNNCTDININTYHQHTLSLNHYHIRGYTFSCFLLQPFFWYNFFLLFRTEVYGPRLMKYSHAIGIYGSNSSDDGAEMTHCSIMVNYKYTPCLNTFDQITYYTFFFSLSPSLSIPITIGPFPHIHTHICMCMCGNITMISRDMTRVCDVCSLFISILNFLIKITILDSNKRKTKQKKKH